MKHPKRRTDLTSKVVKGETVVLNQQHEFVHRLNLTATYIWERCDGQTNVEGIAAQVAETFAVAYETALTDVVRVVSDFQRRQLLEVVPE